MRDIRGRGHGFPFPGGGAASLTAQEGRTMNGTGFRLAHDGIDEHRYRRGRSFTVPGDEAMVGIVLEDFPEFQNARIGIRLTADWSGT